MSGLSLTVQEGEGKDVIMIRGESRRMAQRSLLLCHFSTTNPIRSHPRSKTGLHGENPAAHNSGTSFTIESFGTLQQVVLLRYQSRTWHALHHRKFRDPAAGGATDVSTAELRMSTMLLMLMENKLYSCTVTNKLAKYFPGYRVIL
jgi:hypothetical protein